MNVDVRVVGGSGPRARTRRAILDAAVDVLSADPTASLADIATGAGVGRTTVHRYFPERADLLHALTRTAKERVDEATGRARLEEGPALEALERLCAEYFELGKLLNLVFNDPAQFGGADWEEEITASACTVAGVVERGQAEGAIDAKMDGTWVENLLWAVLYSAWQVSDTSAMPRHRALDMCLYSFRKAIAA